MRAVSRELDCATFLIGKTDFRFRVFLSSDSEHEHWLPVVLVTSRGSANPLEYGNDFYRLVTSFLKAHDLDIHACRCYLDLTEFLGIRTKNLFRWIILSSRDGSFAGQLKPLNAADLPELDQEVLRKYFEDRWSLFSESLLTNEEKADIMALALANSIYDEYTAEDIQASLRHKLLLAVAKGRTLSWNSDQQLVM